MNFIGDIIKYIQKSERLIVVTVVLSLSGSVIYLSERAGVFEFTGLPVWVKPACAIAWVVSFIHVAVRLAMAIPDFVRWLSSLPTRYRTALAEDVLIVRLNATKGLAREVLSYARHRDSDGIWVRDNGRDPNWLRELKRAGLVDIMNEAFHNAHYRIHRVAWKYIKRRPNKFICKVPWEDAPWTIEFDDEGRVNRMIEGEEVPN